MIEFDLNSKLYKYLNFIYNLLKLNFLIMIFSITLVGIGGAISTGIFLIKQLIEKDRNVDFYFFLQNFKDNFKKGLFFTAPFILILFLTLKTFGVIIFNESLSKYLFLIFAMILLGFMFVLLFITGVVESNIKNTILYALIISSKKIVQILLLEIFSVMILKIILIKLPIIFMLFSFDLIVFNCYFLFKNFVNEKYLIS